jgi:hypothetical protein
MQPNTPQIPSIPPSDAPQQAPASHTRQEDAEYIGIEILKDTVGPPPDSTPSPISPRLERLENEWPTPLAKPVGAVFENIPQRHSFLDTVKAFFSRMKR